MTTCFSSLLIPKDNKVKVLWEQIAELSTNKKTEPHNCSVCLSIQGKILKQQPESLSHVNTEVSWAFPLKQVNKTAMVSLKVPPIMEQPGWEVPTLTIRYYSW